MVEELELIRSLFLRFANLEIGANEFEKDWLGSLPFLLQQADYRTPSPLDRAVTYLRQTSRTKQADRLAKLVRSCIGKLEVAQEKIKTDYKVQMRRKYDAQKQTVEMCLVSPAEAKQMSDWWFTGYVSEHFKLLSPILRCAEDIIALCDEMQGYAYSPAEKVKQHPEKQRLLEKWNGEDVAITWDEFAFEVEGVHRRGGAMRKRLDRYAKTTEQFIRPGDPGRKII